VISPALESAIGHEVAALAEASRQAGAMIEGNVAAMLRRGRPLQPPGRVSANGAAHLVRAADGWLAINLARPEDIAALPAWLEADLPGNPVEAMTAALCTRPVAPLLEQARLLGLPVAAVGEAQPLMLPDLTEAPDAGRPSRVIDLSALWAGPLCAGLLARAGLPVLRCESATRPDLTPLADPALDAALNGQKQRKTINLAAPELIERIIGARILVTSGRPHALARLGLTPGRLFALNPALLWVAITGHGWHGSAGLRVGFGDDGAAAGGLVRWVEDIPHFMGDALADPLTGLHAARLALAALAEGKAGLLDVSLAGTAARFAREAGLI
jgi:hypothetical protein